MSDRTTERELIEGIRAKRGPCPDLDRLDAFHAQSLSAESMAEITAHVQLCGTCQVAIEMLDRADKCIDGELPSPPDWEEAHRRSKKRFNAFLNAQRASSLDRPSLWNKVKGFHPVFAYTLVIALLYPAYLWVFGTAPEEPADTGVSGVGAPDMASLPRFELTAAERGAVEKAPAIKLDPGAPFLALAFFIPITADPGYRYDVEILDASGRRVAREESARPTDSLGNFLLVCRRHIFEAGRYTLRVTEIPATPRNNRRELFFHFEMTR